MLSSDTIVAPSSAVAAAARIIVRLAGPRAIQLLTAIAPDASLRGGDASHVSLRFSNLTLAAWVYVFRGPHSYSGDDLMEFHLPGSPLLARLLIDHCVACGARPAEAGEFTARAFLNGRLDLTAAEGVALVIHAQNADELRAARQLLAGELSRRLTPMIESLASMLALVEAGIDFTEEDIDFISTIELNKRVNALRSDIAELMANTSRFERLNHQPSFVLVGRPNVGKSTLLNALAERDRAVVSPQAGTTRDALSADVDLAGGRITLIDVAGLESLIDDSQKTPAERSIAEQMQAAARRTVEEADFVISVTDAADFAPSPSLDRPADLIVLNKSDLMPGASSKNALAISAKTGDGLLMLKSRMNALAFGRSTAFGQLALNARHVDALEKCVRALNDAATERRPGELIAYHLREALDALGQVNGQVTPDDVLGRIFAGFCIGK